MTIDAGEVFNDLIAEYSTAQKLREQADFPAPNSVGMFFMNEGQLHVSALAEDGYTVVWRRIGEPDGPCGEWPDGPDTLWV